MTSLTTTQLSRLQEIMTTEGRRYNWLAGQVGVSPAHLSRVISGERPLTRKLAERIATALGRNIETVFPGLFFLPPGVSEVTITRSEFTHGAGADFPALPHVMSA